QSHLLVILPVLRRPVSVPRARGPPPAPPRHLRAPPAASHLPAGTPHRPPAQLRRPPYQTGTPAGAPRPHDRAETLPRSAQVSAPTAATRETRDRQTGPPRCRDRP